MITEMKKEITDADDNGNEENPEHAMTTCCVRKEEPLPPTEADEPTKGNELLQFKKRAEPTKERPLGLLLDSPQWLRRRP